MDTHAALSSLIYQLNQIVKEMFHRLHHVVVRGNIYSYLRVFCQQKLF